MKKIDRQTDRQTGRKQYLATPSGGEVTRMGGITGYIPECSQARHFMPLGEYLWSV